MKKILIWMKENIRRNEIKIHILPLNESMSPTVVKMKLKSLVAI